MREITKRFPGVTALTDVSLTLNSGEVLALMGENGAGKSTLMKILGGAEQPDAGVITIDGRPIALRDVHDARQRGIAFIHQELMLVPTLDIAANIFLGAEGGRSLIAPLGRHDMFTRAKALLEKVGLALSPSTLVGALTTGQRQMVEVAKALSSSARIIIMDEPTSSLAAGESAALFRIIAQLRSENIGIIYISHRMDEVLQIADRITVLRDGKLVGDVARTEATLDGIVQMMVGRELTGQYFPPKVGRAVSAQPVLEVKNIMVPGASAGVSFTARRGEILGFAGLIGSGRTELMEAIFGATAATSGTMTLDDVPYAPRTTRDAIERGVYLVPEDRKRDGLVLPMSVAENTSLPGISSYNRWGWLDRAAERRVAEKEVVRLHTKTPSIRQRVDNLSGGNQQKVVLGKWLAMSPRVLILDEPTRGIDVGARAEIYRLIVTLCEQGITMLMVSSELEEVIGMSDRVVVMHERRITGVLERGEVTQERIAVLMTGRANESAAA